MTDTGGSETAPDAAPAADRLARAAGALLPWRLLVGPVFQKEMRVSGRKIWTYLARAGYALVLAIVVTIAFWSAWENTGFAGSDAARIQSLQTIAPTVVAAVIWFQFIAALLLAPVMTGGAICDEIRAQTLPTLLTTPLTALQIVCSKIASRMAHLLILTLLALPVLLGVRLFGGVRAETIVAAAALTAACALLAASVGVLSSTLSRRATVASLLTCVILAAVLLAPPLLMWRYNELVLDHFPAGARLPDVLGAWAPDWPLTFPERTLVASSPPVTLGFVVFEGAGHLATRAVWLASVGVTLALSVLACLTSAASVRRVMRQSATGRAPRRRRRKRRGAGAPGEGGQEPEAARLVSRRSRPVPGNPVLWRELRQPLFNRKRTLAAAVAVFVALAALVYSTTDIDEEALAIVPIILGLILVVLQAALLSSGGFAAEREARTLETLLTTRLSPGQMVWSKMLGAIRRQWFVPLVLMIHAGVLVWFKAVHWIALAHVACAIVGPVVLLAGTGVLFGLRFKKSVTAAAVNLALALALWLAIPILTAVLFGALEIAGDEFGEFVAAVLLLSHPVAVGGFSIAEAHGEARDSLLRMEYDFPHGDIPAIGYTALVGLSACVQAAVGVAAAALAQARFAHHTGRAS